MPTIHLLLIEDNPADATLLQASLEEDHQAVSFKTKVAERLSEGLNHMTENKFDLVLLDLGLPDSQGLETLKSVTRQQPEVPVVVLTGLSDQDMGLHAVGQGAQDYLIKGQVDSDALTRVIRYALERHNQQQSLEHTRQDEQRQREMRSITQMAAPPSTAITARAFGQQTIREASEQNFITLCQKYDQLLELALDQRTYNVNHRISDQLRTLAIEIGTLKGGPRDVIEMHTFILNHKLAESPYERLQPYGEESRLLLLELMGHLVTHYRSQVGSNGHH